MTGKDQAAAAFELRHQAESGERRETAQGALDEPDPKADDNAGFTRRCGRRAPGDRSACMYALGHEGRHAWESEDAAA